ncbi:hypothetical protein F5Y05DRAFT_151958 [Hypoxylon sp. FL0543]|nr:hypothetical protein F5Y05DRAFT_151958 [Hypoxylon sp. FL0543]
MKDGEEAGKLPLGTILCVIFVRFILWPAISIPLIWALAARTNILPDDPMLWWALMMMPIGPTAMKVLALADVSGTDQTFPSHIALLYHYSYSFLCGRRSLRGGKSCEELKIDLSVDY